MNEKTTLENPESPRGLPQGVFLGLLLLAALAWAVRGWQINESLWLDELHTSWVVADAAAEIGPRARIGNQSPLYFYLVWLSQRAMGAGERSLRLPSLAAGVALAAAAGAVTFLWSRCGIAALLVALLVGLDRNCIFFAQEARPYALVQLAALLHVYFFWCLQVWPTRAWRTAHIAGAILLFYLHYTALLLFAGELLWYAVFRWRGGWRPGYRPAQLLTDAAIVALACCPALPHVFAIAGRRDNWWAFVQPQSLLVAARWFGLTAYVAVPVAATIVLLAGRGAWAWLARRRGRDPGAAAAAAGGEGLRDERGHELPPRQRFLALRHEMLLVICWFAVPLVTAWLLTATRVAALYFPRYVIASAVAPMMLAGLCIALLPRRRLQAVAAMATLAAAVYGSGMVSQYRRDGRLHVERHQDWRAAVQRVNAWGNERLPVLLRSGLVEADAWHDSPDPLRREYCALPLLGLYRLDGAARERIVPLPSTAAGRLNAEAIARVRARGGAWFVVSGGRHSHPRVWQDVVRSLGPANFQIVSDEAFGSLAVWRIVYTGERQERE